MKRQVDLLREQTRQLTAAETSPQRAGQTGDGPRSTDPAAELTPSFSPTFWTMRTVDRPARVVVVAGVGPRATPTASTTRPFPSLKTSSLLLKMPMRIRRADALPVPFTPADVEHVTNFPESDHDCEEANATFVAVTGAQDIANAACSLYHQRDSLTAGALEARLAWLAVATRIHYRIISARHDYIVASKNEPGLAELYVATDAVPRNRGRGAGLQRFLNAVAADEARVFTKRAAEVRLNGPKRRQKRRPGSGSGGGGGGGGCGGGGGGGGGGGRGGGEGNRNKNFQRAGGGRQGGKRSGGQGGGGNL